MKKSVRCALGAFNDIRLVLFLLVAVLPTDHRVIKFVAALFGVLGIVFALAILRLVRRTVEQQQQSDGFNSELEYNSR